MKYRVETTYSKEEKELIVSFVEMVESQTNYLLANKIAKEIPVEKEELPSGQVIVSSEVCLFEKEKIKDMIVRLELCKDLSYHDQRPMLNFVIERLKE